MQTQINTKVWVVKNDIIIHKYTYNLVPNSRAQHTNRNPSIFRAQHRLKNQKNAIPVVGVTYSGKFEVNFVFHVVLERRISFAFKYLLYISSTIHTINKESLFHTIYPTSFWFTFILVFISFVAHKKSNSMHNILWMS